MISEDPGPWSNTASSLPPPLTCRTVPRSTDCRHLRSPGKVMFSLMQINPGQQTWGGSSDSCLIFIKKFCFSYLTCFTGKNQNMPSIYSTLSVNTLDLLQYEHFRKELVNAQCAKFIDEQQILHWQHYSRKQMRLQQALAEQQQQNNISGK
ncbi:hypothetical protein MJG53_001901 [Ovis ammon polii x Ovis aries]|uniref:Uncharacterized protein n=1 Tax=Ovis ammon polii x Ovis aries TaxID=2918886 RepID=A0ACB9VLN9_9CETA|nr:hypothetical protein MJG53_001901 [Ovis ammon polii x Ovis aries]